MRADLVNESPVHPLPQQNDLCFHAKWATSPNSGPAATSHVHSERSHSTGEIAATSNTRGSVPVVAGIQVVCIP